jgi:hypothetical protein
MKLKLFPALTALILTAFSAPMVLAGSSVVSHNRVHGDGVWADFVSIDGSTCAAGIETRVILQSHTWVGIWENQPQLTGESTISITVFDRCLGAETLSLSGQTTQQQLVADEHLESATLQTTIPAYDAGSDSWVDIVVELSWDGRGRAFRDHTGYVIHGPNETAVSRDSGAIRDARATGSVMVGSINRTPQPSLQAAIEKGADHATTILRPNH